MLIFGMALFIAMGTLGEAIGIAVGQYEDTKKENK